MSEVRWPDHLLTLDEWDALGDDDAYRWVELVEGVLQRVPPPASRHQVASTLLCAQLNAVLPIMGLFAIPDVEVVLRADPATVRVPDISVVNLADARTQPRGYRGDHLLVAIEIVSPGSVRTDRIMKFADYADAGIADYWIVDLVDDRVTLDAFHVLDGRHEPVVQAATGRVTLNSPVPVTLELDALLP